MPEQKKRPRRIAELIQQEIAIALRRNIKDPRLTSVTILSVDVSNDCRNAKVYYSAHSNELQQIAAALQKASGFLRHRLAENTELRYLPKLTFVYDDSGVKAANISSLLKDVPNEKDDTEDSQ